MNQRFDLPAEEIAIQVRTICTPEYRETLARMIVSLEALAERQSPMSVSPESALELSKALYVASGTLEALTTTAHELGLLEEIIVAVGDGVVASGVFGGG